MKPGRLFAFIIIILLFQSCRNTPEPAALFRILENEYENGNFQEIPLLLDSLRTRFPNEERLISMADSLMQISERIRLDFSLTEDQFIQRIEAYRIPVNDSILRVWDSKKWTEWRLIDGQKRYYRRAASNLRLLRMFYENRDAEKSPDPEDIATLRHTEGIIAASEKTRDPVCPVSMTINYTIRVNPDVVPEGETIRCWMPWPRTDHPRQQKIEFLSASGKDFIISPDSMIHKSVYMEQKARRGSPAVFSVSFRYESSGQFINPEHLKPEPYNKESSLYRKYTREEPPQIRFSEGVKKLADSLAAPDAGPFETARLFYMWFKENIPWTGALEYSTMADMPAYVLENMRGDCGMQTLLYISMLRYRGIPARWQSGWTVFPEHENLHDWSEIYFEGTGWIPSDITYDLQASKDKTVREFFISGIDSYRLILNNGISGRLYPEKIHLRSEPYDFQRGEVEWKGGNLYFDKWDYEISIEYGK